MLIYACAYIRIYLHIYEHSKYKFQNRLSTIGTKGKDKIIEQEGEKNNKQPTSVAHLCCLQK